MLRRGLRKIRRELRIRSDPVGYARSIGVRIGADCRILGLTSNTFGSEPYLITLGDHVTVTGGVSFVNHDGGVWVFRADHPDIDLFGPIVVGDNVFIGSRSILLPGVTIGDNCVIGAGAVVTKSIPPGSVAVGCPARVVRTVDEYWERVQDRAFHFRSESPERKRELLEAAFERQLAPDARPSSTRVE